MCAFKSLFFVCFLACFAVPVLTKPQCSNVEVPLCRDALGKSREYRTPFSEKEQKNKRIEDFTPLIHINCSKLSLLFVCVSHLPFCTSHLEIPPLLPCRSVCQDVFSRCFKFFTMIKLPWPKHLNCSQFPQHPSLCISPPSPTSAAVPSSTPSSSTPASSSTSVFPTSATSSTAGTTSIQMSPSPYSTTLSPGTIVRDADRQSPRFLLFLAQFVPKFVFSLHFVFPALVSFLVLLPFIVFIFYCWLRIRGKQGNRNLTREPEAIPLSQRLGPLPPVPEQWRCHIFLNFVQMYSNVFYLLSDWQIRCKFSFFKNFIVSFSILTLIQSFQCWYLFVLSDVIKFVMDSVSRFIVCLTHEKQNCVAICLQFCL